VLYQRHEGAFRRYRAQGGTTVFLECSLARPGTAEACVRVIMVNLYIDEARRPEASKRSRGCLLAYADIHDFESRALEREREVVSG
jgi:hypothetical protein